MSAQTIFGWINTWADGDNPGAGSQSADSNGLNGDWWKIGEKMAHIFNLPATSLKDAIIGGRNLKTDTADGSTIEQDATTKSLKVKAGGITATELATGAVTAGKIADGGVDTAGRLASNVVTTAKILDANVTTAKITDANVTLRSWQTWRPTNSWAGIRLVPVCRRRLVLAVDWSSVGLLQYRLLLVV